MALPMMHFPMSQEEWDDMEDERLGICRVWGYRDAKGLEHESYEAACIYYGADTPASLAAEARREAAIEAIAEQDRIEARGPTFGRFGAGAFDLDIPF